MKKKTLTLTLILILILGCAELIKPTKRPDMQNAIRLKSRIFVPVRRVERKLPEYFKEKSELKRIHVLVQFNKVPSLRVRKNLAEKMKLRVLDPVPERAFFASIPTDISVAKALVDKRLIRWIGRIRPNDKVAPRLLKKEVPAHARRYKKKAELIVQFFGDVNERSQKQALNRHGVKPITRIVPLNGWHVIVNEANILSLAGEDAVKWIVEIPGPVEDDNDGVRSATGVNADPLYDPTGYNLTGNGITVAQWESTHASFVHNDHSARITLGDPPVSPYERPIVHDESVAANGQFDNGEGIYWDTDENGNVSAGDMRATTVGGLAPGNVVLADGDIGTALVLFIQYTGPIIPYEGFTDTVTVNGIYTEGEGIYLDNDFSGKVSDGDTRLTPVGAYAAGSIVSGGSAGPPPVPADTDVGQSIRFLKDAPHYHSTHVAGTVLGDGSQSAVEGGTANQWKGVAPGATLRSYKAGSSIGAMEQGEYLDAAANGVSISTNSWGNRYRGHCHKIDPPNTCYDVGSQFYDAVISGRRSDGTPSGLARQILIFGSAGNSGRPERHTEETAVNGQYDVGESVYWDRDDDGVVSVGDYLRLGLGQPNGTPLVNFNLNEMHDESVNSSSGNYNDGEGIYLDSDSSKTISVGDTRIVARTGSVYADGSIFAAGDTDGGFLRQFMLWGNVRIPNSAKNTIEVASIASDDNILAPSSSRGPTDDGRIKPDLAGPGCQNGGEGGVTSTWPGNIYNTICGTSMSTPAVAGSAALLEEWYRTGCAIVGPTPDIIKALLIHSAEDLTNIPNVGVAFAGPDFAFGYGRARVKEAVELMPHYLKGTAAVLGSTNHTFTIGAIDSFKVTLVWNDPPWLANTAPSAATGILQNDLDLLLIAPDGTQYTPWLADGTNPFTPSTSSVVAAGTPVPANALDHRNTVEQVIVQNAMPGTWTIRVTASGLNLPPQDYVIVSEVLPPNTTDCTANPAADVWVKDNPTDDGTVPSTGAMYLGPDIWNRLNPDGLTTHDNPEFGQPNFLYANIRNNSAVEVKSTIIDAWISTLAVGLVWPDGFVNVGRFNIPNLGPGEVRQIGPLEWSPQEIGHHCMYTRVSSPQDPITFAETSSVWTNAKNSNNIAYKNMTIVNLTSSKSITFLVRNIQKDDADVDIKIDIPDKLLEVGDVQMILSPELEKQWPRKNRRIKGLVPLKKRYRLIRDFEMPTVSLSHKSLKEAMDPEMEKRGLQPQQFALRLPIYKFGAKNTILKGFRMKPRQAERMILTFNSKQTTKAIYHVHVTQQVRGKTIGGILFIVRTGYGKNK